MRRTHASSRLGEGCGRILFAWFIVGSRIVGSGIIIVIMRRGMGMRIGIVIGRVGASQGWFVMTIVDIAVQSGRIASFDSS